MSSIWDGLQQLLWLTIQRWEPWLSPSAWVSTSWCSSPRPHVPWTSIFGTTGTSPLSVPWLTLWWARVCYGVISLLSCAISSLWYVPTSLQRSSRNTTTWTVFPFHSLFARASCLSLLVWTNSWTWFPVSLSWILMPKDWRRSLVFWASHWCSESS